MSNNDRAGVGLPQESVEPSPPAIRWCKDGETCHHSCGEGGRCFREQGCVPLGGSGLDDQWNPIVYTKTMTCYRRFQIAGTISSFVVGYAAGFISHIVGTPSWVPILLWVFAIVICLWVMGIHLFFAPFRGGKE